MPRENRLDTRRIPLQDDKIYEGESIVRERDHRPNVRLTYGNGHEVLLEVSKVLKTGVLVALGRSSLVGLDYVEKVESFNTEGIPLVEELYEKIRGVLNVEIHKVDVSIAEIQGLTGLRYRETKKKIEASRSVSLTITSPSNVSSLDEEREKRA